MEILGKFYESRFSLKYKIIFLFVLAIIVPALFFSTAYTLISRATIKSSIFITQKEIIQRLADRIEQQIEQHSSILSIRPEVLQLSKNKQIAYAKDMLAKGAAFSDVFFLDKNGRELISVSRVPSAKTGAKKNLKKYLTGNRISRVHFSEEDKPFLVLWQGVSGNKGYTAGKLNFSQIWEWIGEVKIGETGKAYVVDSEGKLIAHRETERVFARSDYSSLPVVKDFIANRESSPSRWREYFDEEGRKVVSLYKEIPKTGWAVIIQIPASEVFQPIASMNRSIFLWTALWMILFVLIGYRFVNRIVNPVLKLKAGAEQISKGKLDIKFDIRTGDEIEDLARDFEKMAENLRELDRMREDLIRMIIHDLKNPIAGIMASMDYLNGGYCGNLDEDQKKIIGLAKESCENMTVMVQNLLDVAKMEEGKLQLRKEKVDVQKLLYEKSEQFRISAEKDGKELVVDIANDIPFIDAEKNLIERVVENLIVNALKHTASGGKIIVKAQDLGDIVEVSISDNGIGVPDEYKDKIFEKFVQIERKKAHLRTGAGLGLTFCKMAVETHGGNIRVESEENKGSSFIFTLPKTILT